MCVWCGDVIITIIRREEETKRRKSLYVVLSCVCVFSSLEVKNKKKN